MIKIITLILLSFTLEYCSTNNDSGIQYFNLEGDPISDVPGVDYPVVVYIIKIEGSYEHYCTGTLITRMHVLTATHCIREDEYEGDLYGITYKIQFYSDGIHTYSRYGRKYYKMELGYEDIDFHVKTDLGIIELDIPVPEDVIQDSDFIPLYSDSVQFAVNNSIEQVGYGLPHGGDKYYNTTKIIKMNSDPITWDVNLSCSPTCHFAEYHTSPWHLLEGDSGGPAIITPEGRPMIVGVASTRSPENSYAAIPGDGYTWILNILGDAYIPDADGDTIEDYRDNCPVHYNPVQGYGIDEDDMCGPIVGDGRPSLCDNCPYECNPYQEDSDIYRTVSQVDLSPDQHGDVCDSCPEFTNPGVEQVANADHDEFVNACDYCPDQNPWEMPVPDFMYKDDRTNPENDADHDEYGNLCDLCPYQNPLYPTCRCDEEECHNLIECYIKDDMIYSKNNENIFDEDDDSVGILCDLCPNQSVTGLGRPRDEDDSSVSGNDRDRDTVGNLCDLCPDQNPSTDIPGMEYSVEWDRNDDPYNDMDNDGRGRLCDNCFATPNVDQFNSDDSWDDDSPFSSEAGDACDPDICFRELEIDNDQGCALGAGGMIRTGWDPVVNIKLAYVGHPPSHRDEELVNDRVINSFCDCENYDDHDCDYREECSRNDYYANVYESTGWHFLLRKDDHFPGYILRRFRRLYSESGASVCPEEVTPPFPPETYGCHEGDSEWWYEGAYEEPLRGVGKENAEGQIVEWDWTNEWEFEPENDPPGFDRGCSESEYNCWANVRLYFNIFTTDIEELAKNTFHYPMEENIIGNLELTHYELRASCHPCIAWHGECLGDYLRRMLFASRISPLAYSSYDSPDTPFAAGHSISLIYWATDVVEDVSPWAYAILKDTSAVKGLSVVSFDHFNGRLSGYFRSEFESTDDIIDATDFSAVSEPYSAGIVAKVGIYQGGAEWKKLPKVWVFGGRDLSGYRSDVWSGEPFTYAGDSGETVFQWTRHAYSPAHDYPFSDDPEATPDEEQYSVWPSGRSGSAIFYDSISQDVVVWGGEDETGAKDELWRFNTVSLAWTQITAGGDVPLGLIGFSYSQGMVKNGGAVALHEYEGSFIVNENGSSFPGKQVGYLWGGVKSSGEYSDRLYVLDIATGRFKSYSFPGISPPGMTGASIWTDPYSGRIYLYGGYDGENRHNWLWVLHPESMKWSIVQPDCTEGACPYFSEYSALITSDLNRKKAVIPGGSTEPGIEQYIEPYFIYGPEGWIGGSRKEAWAVEGDCNGDEIKEELFGSMCTNYSDWWNLPGKNECDSYTADLRCNQEASASVDFYRHRVPGLKDLRVRGETIYFFRGRRLFSIDLSNPSNLQYMDSLRLRGIIRDIELWGNKIVAASDGEVTIVDASDPENMVIERTIDTCGNVMDIDVVESSAYFVTRVGIGRVNLQDDSDSTDEFSFLLPKLGGGWEIIDAPMDSCFGFLISSMTDGFGFGRNFPRRFIEVESGNAFVGAWRNFVVVDLDPEGYSITGALRLDSRVTGLKVEDDFAYINLKRYGSPVIDLSDLTEPFIVGFHDMDYWVSGVHANHSRFYRKNGPRIEVAVIR